MEEMKNIIIQRLRRAPAGKIVTPKEFLSLGSRTAVDKAFSRLAAAGKVIRVARGMYVAAQESKFGTYPPSAEKVVSSYGKITGERIAPSGTRAANNLGLTTQVPVQELFLTTGKAGILMLGRRKVFLKHAPAWQMAMPNSKAGEAIRAIAHLGPQSAVSLAKAVRSKLTAGEWKQVSKMKRSVPAWMVKAISEAELVD
ncbi:DUF6088 family protein [Rhizobium sp. A22-96]